MYCHLATGPCCGKSSFISCIDSKAKVSTCGSVSQFPTRTAVTHMWKVGVGKNFTPFEYVSVIFGLCEFSNNGFPTALLGETDILTGQVLCPRSPPDSLASFTNVRVSKEEWIVEGVCAYVPQAAWLRNASIKGDFDSEPGIPRSNLSVLQIIFFSTFPMMKSGTSRLWRCVEFLWRMVRRLKWPFLGLRACERSWNSWGRRWIRDRRAWSKSSIPPTSYCCAQTIPRSIFLVARKHEVH